MLVTMTSTAFAAEPSTSLTSVSEIDGGYLYTSAKNDKNIAVLTNEQLHLIDISICYLPSTNTVYQWTITDYPESAFTTSNSFWNGVIDYAESRITDANVVTFTEITYEEPIELPQTRTSAGADLKEEMASLLGDEYFGNQIYSTTYQKQRFAVLESMQFRILTDGSKSWNTAITVSSLITGILGLAVTNSIVNAICGAFGVAASATGLIPPGKINKYICRALNYRHVTINGSEYPYNITYKFIEYRAYENADINNNERAYIDTSSKSVTYDYGAAYFGSYTDQIQDAYKVFLQVGQKN